MSDYNPFQNDFVVYYNLIERIEQTHRDEKQKTCDSA